jgi:uncharacterized membrane protein
MEKQDLITMEDAVVVVKKADGAITLNQRNVGQVPWTTTQ